MYQSKQIRQCVKRFLEKEEMIAAGQTILAGVSGGSDSMTMLHLLKELKDALRFHLHVVHVNHGIRGEEAARDEAFVQQLCQSWEIPCTSVEISVPDLAKLWKVGEEEAGRIARKQIFQETADKLGLPDGAFRIAVAHNQNDLAETVLHNLARGTGIAGLASMRPQNGLFIRPILCLKKEEILFYLEDQAIPYITDSTNASDFYTRNRMRHHILPVLEQEINYQAVANLARTSQLAALASDYLDCEASKILEEHRDPDGGYLFQAEFWKYPEILRNIAVLNALKLLSGREQDLTLRHVQMILDLHEKQVGKKVNLPYEMEACRRYEGVFLKKVSKEPATEQTASVVLTEQILPIPGTLVLPQGVLTARIFSNEGQKIPQKKYTKWMDYDKIKGTLTVRSRQSGDAMVIERSGLTKPVRRIMIDAKVPSEQRETIPLVAKNQEVLWIVGVRDSEGYRVSQHTGRILELCYQGGDEDE